MTIPTGTLEPEDPCRRDLDDGPTDERASRDCDPGDRAPSAEGLAAHSGGVASTDQRQRQRVRYATADALPPAAMRGGWLGSAHNADATVNTAKPAMNMRRRPYRHPASSR